MSFRRATNIEVQRTGWGIFARHEFRAAGRTLARLRSRPYRDAAAATERGEAVRIADDGARTLWWTSDGFGWDDDGLDAEAVALLAWDRARRRDARIERLRKVRDAEDVADASRRTRIPDDVRVHVWTRDDGRCVQCGSEDDLQFDHVIPVSRGGGNAAENIQILCGACNRAKSDAIA